MFQVGDRVKFVDRPDALPGYVAMRGTVVGFEKTYVLVQWDCDPPGPWRGIADPARGPTPVDPVRLGVVCGK